MRLIDKINEDLKDAMKSKDVSRLSAMRLIKTDLNKAELDAGKELDTEGEMKVLRRMVKQRRDSIEQYRAGARMDLAAREEDELRIIEAMLPAALSVDDVNAVIDAVLAEHGPLPSGTTTGMLIGKIMTRLKATGKTFDGREVNNLVLKKLKP